jgi:transposase
MSGLLSRVSAAISTLMEVKPDIKPYARQTGGAAELARLIGYAVGGRPAERLMRRLGVPQGDDRILRNLKRHAALPSKPLRFVGVDGWSWLKGARYGTIMAGLERRQVVDVLQDRSAKTTAAWLAKHPTVKIVSRDRCGLYAQAARQGAAQARQVGRPVRLNTEVDPCYRSALAMVSIRFCRSENSSDGRPRQGASIERIP